MHTGSRTRECRTDITVAILATEKVKRYPEYMSLYELTMVHVHPGGVSFRTRLHKHSHWDTMLSR